MEEKRTQKIMKKREATIHKTDQDSITVNFWNEVTWFFKFVNLYEVVLKVFLFFLKNKSEKKFSQRHEDEFYTYDYREDVFNGVHVLSEDETKLFDYYWKRRYNFIDIWTIICMSSGIGISIFLFHYSQNMPRWILYFLFFCIQWRILEIASRHTQTALFESASGRKSVHVRHATRIIILLFHNIVELVFLFSSLQMIAIVLNGNVLMDINRSYYLYIRESFLSFITLDGESELTSLGTAVSHIISFEVLIGFWVEMIALARFCGMLPSIFLQETLNSDDNNKK